MKKCPDYTQEEGSSGHYSETNKDPKHPNSCYGCVHLEHIPYECWHCKDDHIIEEVPYSE